MIGLLSNRVDNVFLKKLGMPTVFIDNDNVDCDCLFINWVSKVNEDAWMKQASLLQTYLKKDIPIVIFDRTFSLTKKEVDWVKKFNTYLFEPALNSGRSGFRYLPEWISNFKIVEDGKDREYDVVYSHHQLEYNLHNFEKWFKNYSRLFPDSKVAYHSSISEFKKEEYKKDNLIFVDRYNPVYNNGNVTVAIDVQRAYDMGYFNPMYFNVMNLGCLPLLPVQHKYFHAMFKGLVISNLKDMNYFASAFGKVKDVCIEEIFDRIKKDWNEFTVDHAVDVIKACYE